MKLLLNDSIGCPGRRTDARLIRIGITLWGRFGRDIYSLPAVAQKPFPQGEHVLSTQYISHPTHPSYLSI